MTGDIQRNSRHRDPEVGLMKEPEEDLRQGQHVVRNTEPLRGCFGVQSQTGGSREGSLKEVLWQLDLAGWAALGCGEWAAPRTKKQSLQLTWLRRRCSWHSGL